MKIKKNLFLKLFTVLCLFILISCGSSLERPKSNTDYKNIIGNSIKIGNIEVAQYDFPEKMKWDDAKAAVTKLGDGWGLPTKDELNILYQNKDKIGGFASDVYWSSTEVANYYAWYQVFNGGYQYGHPKKYELYVRVVRVLEQSAAESTKNNEIGCKIKITKIFSNSLIFQSFFYLF